MWELIILGGILILFWIMLRLGVNYLSPHRQDSNSKNAFSSQLFPLARLTKCHKDEKLDSLSTSRYENGKKLSEGHHKNGKEIGLWTQWFENGKKNGKGVIKMENEMVFSLFGMKMGKCGLNIITKMES